MRMNKYPFLLWLTEEREDLKLDFQNKMIESAELGKSTIKELPIHLVVILKYLPILILLPFLYYPTNEGDFFPFIGAFFVCGFLFFIYLWNTSFFKPVAVFITLLNFSAIFFIVDYAVFLDTSITFFIEITLFLVLSLDVFYFKGFKNWFFVESFKNEIDIRVASAKERKLLFWKKKVGFNVKRKLYIKGCFLRIADEDIK